MENSRVRLIERSQMQEILKEQGFQQSGCTSDACAVEIGQLLGVRNMVIGTVGTAGSYTVVSVRALDVRTGEVAVYETIRTKGGIDKVLEEGVTRAARKLVGGLFGEPGESPEGSAVDEQDDEGGTGLKRGLIITPWSRDW